MSSASQHNITEHPSPQHQHYGNLKTQILTPQCNSELYLTDFLASV